MTRPMREKFASKLTWLEKKLKDPRVPTSGKIRASSRQIRIQR
jgi:hypothetical protein